MQALEWCAGWPRAHARPESNVALAMCGDTTAAVRQARVHGMSCGDTSLRLPRAATAGSPFSCSCSCLIGVPMAAAGSSWSNSLRNNLCVTAAAAAPGTLCREQRSDARGTTSHRQLPPHRSTAPQPALQPAHCAASSHLAYVFVVECWRSYHISRPGVKATTPALLPIDRDNGRQPLGQGERSMLQ